MGQLAAFCQRGFCPWIKEGRIFVWRNLSRTEKVACLASLFWRSLFLQASCEWLTDLSLREGGLGSLGSDFSWLRLGRGSAVGSLGGLEMPT